MCKGVEEWQRGVGVECWSMGEIRGLIWLDMGGIERVHTTPVVELGGYADRGPVLGGEGEV